METYRAFFVVEDMNGIREVHVPRSQTNSWEDSMAVAKRWLERIEWADDVIEIKVINYTKIVAALDYMSNLSNYERERLKKSL